MINDNYYMGDNTAKWVVDIKGNGLEGSFEISILRDNNNFGKSSWGWHKTTKILFCGFMAEYSSETCEKMNKKEGFI